MRGGWTGRSESGREIEETEPLKLKEQTSEHIRRGWVVVHPCVSGSSRPTVQRAVSGLWVEEGPPVLSAASGALHQGVQAALC